MNPPATREPNPDSSIREHFRIGASRVYGRLVWLELFKLAAANGRSGRAVAEAAGIDASAPSKGRKDGEISFPYLVTLMAALDISHPRALPGLPPKDRLAAGGYRDALRHVRDAESPGAQRPELEVEDVDCLLLSYRESYVRATPEERKNLASGIVERVGGKAAARAREAGGAHEYLRQLRSAWTDAWKKTVVVVMGSVGWAKLVRS